MKTKESDQCPTPDWIMNMFKDFFDPCPLNPNPTIDGLAIDWKDKTYVNPPYSNPLPWVEKAIKENKKGKYIVMLLRMDCSTKSFRLLMEAKARIMFINCRIKFSGKWFSPYPNALFILDGKN